MACQVKKGFASVYIAVMLSALILLILAVLEISSGYAASGITENVSYIAGRSVLSEYNPQLFERYGIYAIKKDDAWISGLASHFAEESLLGKNVVSKCRLESLSAVSLDYDGENLEVLKKQIVDLGIMTAAKTALLDTEVIKSIASGDYDVSSSDFERELSDIKNQELTEDNKKSAAQQKKEAKELLDDYHNAIKIGNAPPLLFAGGLKDLSSEALFCDEYILSVCSNALKSVNGASICSEAEYMLFASDDGVNIARVKSSLFWFRMGIDLAEIFTDPQKLAEVNTIAAAFPAIPLPVAAMAAASIMAAQKASMEVNTLFAGGSVPLISGNELISDYEDYLRLLLLLVPLDTKLLRLMHVIEADVPGFYFSEHVYGFDLTADYVKRSYMPGFAARHRVVTQTHAYK